MQSYRLFLAQGTFTFCVFEFGAVKSNDLLLGSNTKKNLHQKLSYEYSRSCDIFRNIYISLKLNNLDHGQHLDAGQLKCKRGHCNVM